MENCDLVIEVLSGNAVRTCFFEVLVLEGVPEPGQAVPFSVDAKKMLEKLVCGKKVSYEERGVDRYGRTVVAMRREGKSVNDAMFRFFRSFSKNNQEDI